MGLNRGSDWWNALVNLLINDLCECQCHWCWHLASVSRGRLKSLKGSCFIAASGNWSQWLGLAGISKNMCFQHWQTRKTSSKIWILFHNYNKLRPDSIANAFWASPALSCEVVLNCSVGNPCSSWIFTSVLHVSLHRCTWFIKGCYCHLFRWAAPLLIFMFLAGICLYFQRE